MLLAALGVGRAAEVVATAPTDSVFFFFLYLILEQVKIISYPFAATAGSGVVPPAFSVAPTSDFVDPSS